ncbi:hypothetical protein P7K49_009037, partial [Saguinus oedipus]
KATAPREAQARRTLSPSPGHPCLLRSPAAPPLALEPSLPPPAYSTHFRRFHWT